MQIRSIRTRLYLLGAVALVSLLVLSGYSAYMLHDNMMSAKVEKIKNLSETGLSIVKYFAGRVTKGEITEPQAQEFSKEVLRSMRYDDTNYMFGYDWDGLSVFHGGKPEREGKNWVTETDPNGFQLIKALADLGKTDTGGSVFYMTGRAGSTLAIPKVSYVLPFKPWKWGVSTGIYIDDVDTQFNGLLKNFSIFVAAVMAILFGFATLQSRAIANPLKALVDVTNQIAQGDYKTEVPVLDRKDEIGQLARSVLVLRDEAAKAQELRVAQEFEKTRASEERHQMLQDVARRFEDTVRIVIETIALKVEENDMTAKSMNKTAESAAQEAASVSAAALEVTSGVQTVAAATEELSSSVAEIAEQTQYTRKICGEAVQKAQETDVLVHSLSETVDKINEVVQLINAIADQTNLLALNATIEAARAGEAGKGFAVVAGEVKSLANQTAKATNDIGLQIDAVKNATAKAVEAIKEIGGVITKINDVNGSVAAAVEEQSSATKEISRSIQQASTRATNVSDFIGSLTQVMNEVGESAGIVSVSSSVVKTEMGNLYDHVEDFLKEVKG